MVQHASLTGMPIQEKASPLCISATFIMEILPIAVRVVKARKVHCFMNGLMLMATLMMLLMVAQIARS